MRGIATTTLLILLKQLKEIIGAKIKTYGQKEAQKRKHGILY